MDSVIGNVLKVKLMNRTYMQIQMVVVALSALLSGCASFSPPLSADEKSDPGSAYIFGRFIHTRLNEGRGNFVRIGLDLQSESGESRLLEFVVGSDVITVVAVPPGIYAVKKVLVAAADGAIMDKQETLSPDVTAPFHANAGNAYYIGDYACTSHKGWVSEAHINTIVSNDQTITDFKAKYPSLGQIQIVEPLQLPAKVPQ